MRLGAAALVGLLACGPLVAQAQSGDGEKAALAERIIKAQMGPEFEGLLQALANSTSGVLVKNIGPRLEGVPEDKREAARKELNDALNAHIKDVDALLKSRAPAVLSKTLTPMYTERFSTEELKQLVAFFESDVLKKYQQAAPEMRQKLVQGIQQDAEKPVADKIDAFGKKADAILAKYGAKPGDAKAANKPAAAAKPTASAPAKK
jgi:hypothetical protein